VIGVALVATQTQFPFLRIHASTKRSRPILYKKPQEDARNTQRYASLTGAGKPQSGSGAHLAFCGFIN
jgi:hypothetical protein